MIFVMMGPCGCGKTTVGSALAARLGAVFLEGDTYHPPQNRAKMTAGEPLTDSDRWPWLDRLGSELGHQHKAADAVVLSCSALKRSYRDRLRRADAQMPFVLLDGSKDLLRFRLEERQDHFIPASLLDSQLNALEVPATDEFALTVDVALNPDEAVERIIAFAAAYRE